MPRLTNRLAPLVVIAASALIAASPTLAQSRGGGSRVLREQSPVADKVVNVEFTGGSLADYFKGISKLAPDANLIVPAGADRVPMPPVQLTAVSLRDAIMLPNAVTDLARVASIGGGQVTTEGGDVVESQPYFAVQVDGSVSEPATRRTIEVDFPGGTAVEYIEAVQVAAGAAQVVAMPGVESFAMPRTELRGVVLADAIKVLESASDQNGSKLRRLDVSSPSAASRNSQAGFIQQTGDRSVYVVRVFESGAPPSPVSTHVWSLSEMLNRSAFKADDILTAVETALTLDESTPNSIRYHEQTQLLIVRGDDNALTTVDGVLNGLKSSSYALGKAVEHDGELVYEVRKAELELAHLVAKLEQAEEEYERMAVLAKAGNISDSEVTNAKVLIANMRGQIDLAQLRLQQAKLKLETYRAGPEGLKD